MDKLQGIIVFVFIMNCGPSAHATGAECEWYMADHDKGIESQDLVYSVKYPDRKHAVKDFTIKFHNFKTGPWRMELDELNSTDYKLKISFIQIDCEQQTLVTKQPLESVTMTTRQQAYVTTATGMDGASKSGPGAKGKGRGRGMCGRKGEFYKKHVVIGVFMGGLCAGMLIMLLSCCIFITCNNRNKNGAGCKTHGTTCTPQAETTFNIGINLPSAETEVSEMPQQQTTVKVNQCSTEPSSCVTTYGGKRRMKQKPRYSTFRSDAPSPYEYIDIKSTRRSYYNTGIAASNPELASVNSSQAASANSQNTQCDINQIRNQLGKIENPPKVPSPRAEVHVPLASKQKVPQPIDSTLDQAVPKQARSESNPAVVGSTHQEKPLDSTSNKNTSEHVEMVNNDVYEESDDENPPGEKPMTSPVVLVVTSADQNQAVGGKENIYFEENDVYERETV